MSGNWEGEAPAEHSYAHSGLCIGKGEFLRSRVSGTNAWLGRSLALPKTADIGVSNSRTRSASRSSGRSAVALMVLGTLVVW